MFNITRNSEGGLQLDLVEGVVFSEELMGVFTCVISDEEGDLHQLSVGIYPHEFSGVLRTYRGTLLIRTPY